jgi:hypothetical protein
MSKPKMVPLREVLDLLNREARSARREAVQHVHNGTETGRWEAFRLRHYSMSVQDVASIIRDYYGGYGA